MYVKRKDHTDYKGKSIDVQEKSVAMQLVCLLPQDLRHSCSPQFPPL